MQHRIQQPDLLHRDSFNVRGHTARLGLAGAAAGLAIADGYLFITTVPVAATVAVAVLGMLLAFTCGWARPR